MSNASAPCSWPVSYAGCTLDSRWTSLDEDQRTLFEQAAVEFLWRWTGRSLGVCSVTIRPCRRDLSGAGGSTFDGRGPVGNGGTPWRPVLVGGKWYNVGCGVCGFDSCGCDSASAISLPGKPVEVAEVRIDGVTLPPDSYRLDGRWLIRTDGDGWPTAQSLNASPDDPGTWSVTYTRGTPVPVGGRIAAGVLAIELWKAACGDEGCGLPTRFQSITRQGVTVAMLDSFDDIDKGHTGIYLIDSWVASMMLTPQRSRVLSPDIPRERARVRQTFPTGSTDDDVEIGSNLKIKQGTTYSHGWMVTYEGTPIDGTWTGRSQVRPHPTSDTVLHEFDVSVGGDGSVVIQVPAAVSSQWSWRQGVYDLEVSNADDSVTFRVASGSVSVSPEITR